MKFMNKASVVLLLLSVVLVAGIIDARVDLRRVSDDFNQPLGWNKYCTSCECKEESGVRKCHRTDVRVGDCPVVCGKPCICTRDYIPTCQCTYKVDTCNPEKCNSVVSAAADLLRAENLLILNKN